MRVEAAIEQLSRELNLTVIHKNAGRQLVLSSGEKIVDFWPSTGKFIMRGTGQAGKGITQLKFAFNPEKKPVPPKNPKPELVADIPIDPNADPDKCRICQGKSAIGVHGRRNGLISSRWYCAKCYVKKYKMGASKEELRQYMSEE